MEKLQNTCKKALELLKKGGADNAQARASFVTTNEFNVDSGRFSLYRTLYRSSLSLQALIGGREGRASAESLEEEDVRSLAADCLASAAAAKPDDCRVYAAENRKGDFVSGAVDCDREKLFERSKELLETVKTRFPLIVMEQMIISHDSRKTVYADASGTVYTRRSGEYTVSLMYSAHDGDKTSSFFGSDAVCTDLDRPFIELGRMEEELAEVQRQIETKPVEGKFTGTVVLTPGVFDWLIDNAAGNFASGGALFEGTSPWAESVGKRVASPGVTLRLAPKDGRIVNGPVVSAEGFLNEDFCLIEDGVLQGFVLSHYYANKLKKQPSPNTTPCYVVDGGGKEAADIIKGVQKGLLVGRLSGGRPSAGGEFSAVAKNSFLIEDGEIKDAVSETMINGNIRDMLMQISAVSAETVEDGNSVLPFASVENVVISGR